MGKKIEILSETDNFVHVRWSRHTLKSPGDLLEVCEALYGAGLLALNYAFSQSDAHGGFVCLRTGGPRTDKAA